MTDAPIGLLAVGFILVCVCAGVNKAAYRELIGSVGIVIGLAGIVLSVVQTFMLP